MNLKNIQIVFPISEANSLAQVECVHEDLKTGYRKYEIFFIDRNNQIVAVFENAESFSVEQLVNNKHLFDVMIDFDDHEKHQIIRIENGKQILLNTYDDVEHGEEDGTFAVQKEGLWGFIDTDGNEIITPQYEDYDSFNDGIAIVRKNRKRGYINKLGQNITPLKYWHCHYFYGGIAVAENFDHTSEVIDKSGKVLLKGKPYREIFNLGNGSVLVERKKQGYEIVKIKG
jgi:hypothetical protein